MKSFEQAPEKATPQKQSPSFNVIGDLIHGAAEEHKTHSEASEKPGKGKREASGPPIDDVLRDHKRFCHPLYDENVVQGISAEVYHSMKDIAIIRLGKIIHEQRVEYARTYELEVDLSNTPEEVLSAVNKQREETGKAPITLSALDRKARMEDAEKARRKDIMMIRLGQIIHEQRVEYARTYELEVDLSNTPGEILSEVNEQREEAGEAPITLGALDRKARREAEEKGKREEAVRIGYYYYISPERREYRNAYGIADQYNNNEHYTNIERVVYAQRCGLEDVNEHDPREWILFKVNEQREEAGKAPITLGVLDRKADRLAQSKKKEDGAYLSSGNEE